MHVCVRGLRVNPREKRVCLKIQIEKLLEIRERGAGRQGIAQCRDVLNAIALKP